MSEVFKLSRIVEFNHCDPAGIVFYPRYFEMISATVERFFAGALDFSWGQMGLAGGIGVPMGNINTDFHNPSRLGDTLDFELTVTRLGRASVTFQILCLCEGQKRFTCTATLVYANVKVGKSLSWPDALRENLVRFLTTDDTRNRKIDS